MDINDLRVATTVVSLVLFCAIAVHAWARRRRDEHDAAARLPFADETHDGGAR